MPLADINDVVDIPEHLAHSFDHPVDAQILLERICLDKIVIAIVGGPPDEPASHIGLSLYGQQRDAHRKKRRERERAMWSNW